MTRRRAPTPAKVRAALLRWYDAHHRDLPWRRSDDPYAVWISETMLQQTRVETVIPYYERFMARFPDVEALASADQEDVYGHWAGLGYYSRARNLHAAAREVVDRFDGELPGDAEALRSLPGIGRYTAGAVASIAFDRREPVVDGNVARVLTRLYGIREDVASRAVTDRLWEEAGALARGRRPGDLNQALMELGATLCTPRSPRCLACPLAAFCDARAAGDADTLPTKRKRKPPVEVAAAAVWLERRGKLLAVRRAAGGLLGGLWGPPGGDLEAGEDPAGALRRHLETGVGLRAAKLEPLGALTHVFTHRTLELHLFHCDDFAGRTRLSGFDGHRWASPTQLLEMPQSALARRALELLDARASGGR